MKHLIRLFGSTALALGLVLLVGPVTQAEDIDLFTGVNPAGGNVPTVMLYMHNTRNSNANVAHNCTYSGETGNAANPALGDTVGGMEQCAMVNALLSIKNNPQLLGRLKVGLMVFNNSQFSSFDNGSSTIGNGNGACGYVSFVPTLMDSGGIDAIVASIKTYDGNNYLVPNRAVGDGMASAWAMLNGLQDDCANIDYSTLSTTATECRDAVIVYIGNLTKTTAKAEDDPSGKPRVDQLLHAQLTEPDAFGYSTTSAEYKLFTSDIDVTLLNDGNGLYQADDWARFMKRVNVDDYATTVGNITTYTIGVYDPGLTSQLQDQINFLAEMAKQGGGKAFTVQASEAQGFEDILIQIFTEVQAVNSVFSSATLPVSANTQGTFLNQVYIAMFRPDAQAGPRWFGNVKQYQLAFDSGGNIILADSTQDTSNAVSATNPNNGALADNAVSFWTTNSPTNQVNWPDEGYWINDPKGAGLQFDSADGDLVEKGGAGQMARIDYLTGQDSRKVYSCSSVGGCGSSGAAFVEFTKANFEASGDTLFGLTASGGGAPTVTIGSINGVDSTLVVDYTCTNKGVCTFALNTNTVDIFPGFNAESGQGNSKIPADKVGITSTDLGNSTCTFASPCEVESFGGGTDPFFVVDLGNSFNNENSTTNGPAQIELYRFSAHIDVTQSSHGYSVGEEIELTSCTADGGTHSNEGVVATGTGTFIEEVETVVSTSAYTVALDGNSAEVALSTGITCGGGTAALTAANLIDWVRGLDNAGNETADGPCPLNSDGSRTANDGTACSINVRPSIHGDVLHSRPAVINYGDIDNDNQAGETDVVVFYGSNDGHFRAINGNQSRSINGVRPGGELWSFIAPDFFTKLPRQFNDDPRINYTGIVDPAAVPRDYFFDGTTSFLQDNRSTTDAPNTGGKKFVFLSARRGGPILYAIDVTNPAIPKFLWSKTDADIPELGQTWSQPAVTLVNGHSNPVVIFGAGYDGAEDADPAPAVSDISKGRGIIVLDAVDGSLVWAALASCTGVTGATASNCVDNSTLSNDLERPIAADITLFDNNFDGITDRLYAADLGGNLWRVDLEPGGNTAPSNWTLTQLADISGNGNDARKFFFAPDVISTSAYDIVVVVSGDREKPLFVDDNTAGLAYNVNNRFYLIVDKNGGDSVAAGTAVVTELDLVDRTETKCLNASDEVVSCSYDATEDRYEDASGAEATLITLTQIVENFSGFYITLEGSTDDNDGDSEGEKGINAPLAVAGSVFFGTNQPDIPTEGSCTANLGIARGYKVDIFTGEKTVNIFSGGGMPPSPIAGLVTIGDKTVPFLIGGEGPSAFDPSDVRPPVSGSRERTYWYYQ